MVLPLSLPGVFAGTLLTFIPAVGDFVNAQFLVEGSGPLLLRLMWTGETLKKEQVLDTIWTLYDEFFCQTNGVAVEDAKECFARMLVP